VEYLVRAEQNIPPDTDPVMMADVKAREYRRALELVDAGILKRVWRIPGRRALFCLYETAEIDELHAALSSLPLFPWLDIEVIPLAGHHLDPEAE
jgi:muconolactone D-isomerase